MPKIVKARWLREYLEARTNTPIPKSQICEDLHISPHTIKRKIKQLLDDDPDLCLLCCVYHVTVDRNNGNGKRSISQFAGGYMIYDPETADEATREIIRETWDWLQATGRAFTRIAAKQFSRKPVIQLLPQAQRKNIKKISEKYQIALDNDYESAFQFGG
jgi:hypothetical protein